MTTRSGPARADEATATALAAVRLSRGITATWWYTFAAIVLYAVVLVFVWTTSVLASDRGAPVVAAVGVGGLVWVLGVAAVLMEYRNRYASDDPQSAHWRRALIPVAVAVAYGLVAGLSVGSWLFAVLPLLLVLSLLDWGPGIRLRVVLAATILLGVLWFVDIRFTFPGANWFVVGVYSVFLPAVAVFSLWWWDVLVALDRARASEARLGATQERLRVATDVHDLQGHHLQVIALQLQLTERLMGTDAGSALEHLRAARASVDEARQGTRDLATRFRSVPLSSELANAVDLLRAAGTSAEASVHPDADLAPASVLAPVIRETTTNVLRHGGGRRARLSLDRTPTSWRFEITNDADHAAARDEAGSGLDGIARRVQEVGGHLEVERGPRSFAVVVTVPAETPR